MNLTEEQIDEAAEALWSARRDRRRLESLDGALRPASVDDGYRIQDRGHQIAGVELGPWKVGATSAAAQAALSVDAPFLGRPPADRVVASGAELVLADWFVGAPALEIEVGLRPTVDLTADVVTDDPLDLAEHVEVVPCVELVNARFVDMGAVGAPSLIGDNAVASAIVVGDVMPLTVEEIRALDAVPVRLEIDGREVAVGSGADALGHPLAVLAFAARLALGQGRRIEADQLVITGTCTGVVDGVAGTDVVGRIGAARVEVGLR